MVRNQSSINRFSPQQLMFHEYWNYSGVRPAANFNGNIILYTNDGSRVLFYDALTNFQHMRGLKNYSLVKPPNTTRIVVLGDSFAWGDEFPLKFSFPYRLEKLIPNSEVLNMGIRGTGIDNMYLRWKYDSLNYKPDAVIYAIYIPDIQRIRPCINKPKFDIKNGKLHITNLPPPNLTDIFLNYKPPKFESFLFKHIIYNIRYFRGVEETMYRYGLKALNPILEDMKSRSEKDDTYLLVLLITEANNNVPSPLKADITRQLKDMLEEKNIAYADSSDIFRKESYNLKDEDSMHGFSRESPVGHLTPRGYAYLAQGIKNNLEEAGIVKKSKNFHYLWVSNYYKLVLINKLNTSDVEEIASHEVIPDYLNDSEVPHVVVLRQK